MPEEYSLPIEKDPELLAEYGRAFAWINAVEFTLINAVSIRGKLFLANNELREKIISNNTLGQTIRLADGLVDPGLLTDLYRLNDKRTILAHSIILENIGFDSVEGKTVELGSFMVEHKKKHYTMDKKYLGEIITLAHKCLKGIKRELTQGFDAIKQGK